VATPAAYRLKPVAGYSARSVRYVVANPSSYPYLNETRYQINSKGEVLKTSIKELADCSGFNGCKYGTDTLYGYAENLSKQIIRTRLLTRPVMFLLGAEDTGRGWMLDNLVRRKLKERTGMSVVCCFSII
jgi:hypothetical protein